MQLFGQVTIIGVGLIGGSIGKALRKRHLCRKVVGVARRRSALAEASKQGAIDRGFLEIAPAVKDADLVIVATPPSRVVEISQKVARTARRGVILTDVASTKANVIRGWERSLPKRFLAVASHPMAGSEKTGVKHASADLFEGALCILTPTVETNRKALNQVRRLWKALGMRVTEMSAQRHDERVAMISHAPHLLAASLVSAARPDELKIAAAGFLDTTRVALGDPALWEDICFNNRAALLGALARVERALVHVRQSVAYGDRKELQAILVESRRRRGRLSKTRA
ncbi:MAG: prephenate dehydrogenase/arogenate dehydrogenase family protein [Candidatus Omnitrophica bacterium]|nr:prephenate dehydrogenase/arogenate dehydrogenase family protein [Candidatus Omnitrophota bacterium]